MKELLDRLAQYNLFNYLLPGALFAVLVGKVSSFRLLQDDVLTGLLVYYFCGLVVSRIGSLGLEPCLRWCSFVTFAPYKDFVLACQKDAKLEVLSEANNMYRTLCALFLCLGGVAAFDRLAYYFGVSRDIQKFMLLTSLLFLFALSYRKQTDYVRRRVSAHRS